MGFLWPETQQERSSPPTLPSAGLAVIKKLQQRQEQSSRCHQTSLRAGHGSGPASPVVCLWLQCFPTSDLGKGEKRTHFYWKHANVSVKLQVTGSPFLFLTKQIDLGIGAR